jgi:hypothetical protein
MKASSLLPVFSMLLASAAQAHPGHGSHSNPVEAITHQWSTLEFAIVGLALYFLGGSLMRLAKGALTVRRPVDE